MTLISLSISERATQRLRLLMLEELARINWNRRTMPRAHVGYHELLERSASECTDVIDAIDNAPKGQSDVSA